jgi:hypothetical protein
MNVKRFLWVGVEDSNHLLGRTGGDKTPAFLTLQSLATFPGAALAVTIVWRFSHRFLDVPLADRDLVVGVASGVVGLVLLVWGWSSLKSGAERLGGIVLSAVNSMYLALSVVGVDVTLF